MSGYSGITVEAACRQPGWLQLRRYKEGSVVKSMVVEANEVRLLRDGLNRHLRRMRADG